MIAQGFDFDPGSPRTSEVDREEAGGVEAVNAVNANYDVTREASIFVNRRCEQRKGFSKQSRMSCDFDDIEN